MKARMVALALAGALAGGLIATVSPAAGWVVFAGMIAAVWFFDPLKPA